MINNIFYNNLDFIDLHGYDMDSARVAIVDFISDSYTLGRNKVVIIHGIGEGKVRKIVHEELDRNKLVKSYKLDNENVGLTIVDMVVNNILDKH